MVVSPVSLSAALAMAMNSGATAGQMRAALGLTSLTLERANTAWAGLIAATNAMKPGEARIADSLWLGSGIPFRQSFLATDRDYFAADLRDLPQDLATAPVQINDWVARRTGGRIKDLVSTLDPATALVLVNTVYVKVGWDVFKVADTSPPTFVSRAAPSFRCRR